MVELRGVSKLYARPGRGRVEALVDASLRVEPGELLVVAGPGGSGKSTLLRVMWGDERPTRGQVLVDGSDLGALGRRALAGLRQRIGIIPQDRRLLADRTAFGNVAFVLRALATPRSEVRPRALEALGAAGLGGRLTALPGQLSEGERQRLCVARALATDPDLVLADEPTAMLDEQAAAAVVGLLREAHAGGATVVVATHDPDLAERLAGRRVRLEAGRLAPEASAA